MDYQSYIEKFGQLNGLQSVSFILQNEGNKIISSHQNEKINDDLVEKLGNFLAEEVLDLNIKHFQISQGNFKILAYLEEKTIILLFVNKKVPLEDYKKVINDLLNQILISQ